MTAIRFGPDADEHGILQVWTTASAQVGGSFRRGLLASKPQSGS